MTTLRVQRAFQATMWLVRPGLRPGHAGYEEGLDRKVQAKVLARHPWLPIQRTTNPRALGILHVGGQRFDVICVKGSKMTSLRMSLTRERKSSLAPKKPLRAFRQMTLFVSAI